MVQLKHSEKRILEDALDMGSGYVLDFYDRTFAEFFDDQGIKIYQEKYDFMGTSKAKHMRAFIEVEDTFTVLPRSAGIVGASRRYPVIRWG
jgi:hypothetical protein